MDWNGRYPASGRDSSDLGDARPNLRTSQSAQVNKRTNDVHLDILTRTGQKAKSTVICEEHEEPANHTWPALPPRPHKRTNLSRRWHMLYLFIVAVLVLLLVLLAALLLALGIPTNTTCSHDGTCTATGQATASQTVVIDAALSTQRIQAVVETSAPAPSSATSTNAISSTHSVSVDWSLGPSNKNFTSLVTSSGNSSARTTLVSSSHTKLSTAATIPDVLAKQNITSVSTDIDQSSEFPISQSSSVATPLLQQSGGFETATCTNVTVAATTIYSAVNFTSLSTFTTTEMLTIYAFASNTSTLSIPIVLTTPNSTTPSPTSVVSDAACVTTVTALALSTVDSNRTIILTETFTVSANSTRASDHTIMSTETVTIVTNSTVDSNYTIKLTETVTRTQTQLETIVQTITNIQNVTASITVTATPTTSSCATSSLLSLTCKDDAVYTTSNNPTRFRKQCHVDYPSTWWVFGQEGTLVQDINHLPACSFEECMELCATYNSKLPPKATKCKAVSFSALYVKNVVQYYGNCFIKNERGMGDAFDPGEIYKYMASAYMV